MADTDKARIEKEKEMVAKMTGAKQAMDSALSRVKTLETAIRSTNSLLSDMKSEAFKSTSFAYETYHTNERGSGNGKGFVRVEAQLARAIAIGLDVL